MIALFAALLGAPALPGAKCRGRSYLFDEQQPHEDGDDTRYRHNHALRLCSTCPALQLCEDWFAALPRTERPPGVVAGKVNRRSAGLPRSARQTPRKAANS